MALMTSYLLKTSNLSEFFNAIRSARAPERFTHKFLKDLEFKSSNDRLLLGILKGLGYIDDAGVPQQRYFDFLDQTNSGRVLAEAIQDAYSDLFDLRKDAQNLEIKELRGKLRSLTQGQKSDNVINNMAATFAALSDQADWSKPKQPKQKSAASPDPAPPPSDGSDSSGAAAQPPVDGGTNGERELQLHYNIQLILPPSRDPAVFDALFASLKRHLL